MNVIASELNRPILIAGPCAVESREQIRDIAAELSAYGVKYLRGGVFKPRTSPASFQGLEDQGLLYLRQAADEYNMILVTETLDSNQLERSIDLIDVIQIGSKNMTSYSFLKFIGKIASKTKKPVILKRGFQSTLREFLYAAEYISNEGATDITLCLRGIRTFEQIDSITRFTPDLTAILELRDMMAGINYPIIFDPSHSTGYAKYVLPVAKAAMVLGADGLLVECHNNPESALSDGRQSILPSEVKYLTDYLSNFSQNENNKHLV